MFDSIIENLRCSVLPETKSLRQRFDLALVKKLGVLSQPYHCRTTDPKINPPAVHLFWAALILEDPESVGIVAAIVETETADSLEGRGGEGHGNMDQTLAQLTADLLDLAPDIKFRRLLEEKLAGKWANGLPFLINKGTL